MSPGAHMNVKIGDQFRKATFLSSVKVRDSTNTGRLPNC